MITVKKSNMNKVAFLSVLAILLIYRFSITSIALALRFTYHNQNVVSN